MHSLSHHHHNSLGEASTRELVGWRYDLNTRLIDIFLFRGQVHNLRLRTANLAHIQSGEAVLDVGCGTGTLAIAVQQRVGATCHVAGIDPGIQQIAHASSKAARRNLPIDFQIGSIEHIPFPDQAFDVVLSTLMMHHLPADLKREGLAEIARVLKPGGRLVIADFNHRSDHSAQAAQFHAGGNGTHDLITLVKDAGFSLVATEEMQPLHFSTFPGATLVWAQKS